MPHDKRPQRPPDLSKNSISGRVRYSRDKLPRDETDWARFDAMTEEEVVAAALSDPDAQPLTPDKAARPCAAGSG